MVSLDSKGHKWNAEDKLRIEAYFKPNEIAADSSGNLPLQRFASFEDTSGITQMHIDFAVEPRCAPSVQDNSCACIAFNGAPAECHNGEESDRPYCYVSSSCASRVSGTDRLLKTPTNNWIILCSGADCSAGNLGNNAQQFKLKVKTPQNEFECFVNAPLEVGQWNKVFFELGNNVFTTGVGGLTHTRAFDTQGWDMQNTFNVGEWEIGGDQNGINGVIDHFKLSIGEGTFSSTEGSSSGVDGGAIAAAILVPLIILALCALAYYFRESIMECWNKQSAPSVQMGYMQKSDPFPVAPQANNYATNQARTGGLNFNYSRTEQNAEWYYVKNDESVGPLKEAAFMRLVGSVVSKDTLVWNGTTVEEWVEAKNVSELKGKFNKRPPPFTAKPPPRRLPTTNNVMWNYVGPDGTNEGPVKEIVLVGMRLPKDTYVWNGTTVNEWTYIKDTYLANRY